MKKYVYLAGPIEGCNEGEINVWRKKCHVGFIESIVGISPYRAEMASDDSESRKRIAMKNYMDTQSSDLILAYLPKTINERRHSYGTTMEIAWGYSLRKPVVIVSDDPQVHSHPLLDMSGAMFEELDDGIDYINILLGEYERNKYERYVN